MNLTPVKYCPICDNNSYLIGLVKTINPKCDDFVELRSCASCGHWWHSPTPSQEELESLYSQENSFVVGPNERVLYREETGAYPFHRIIFRHLSHSRENQNYLEIGAGGGNLLLQFKTLGYQCYGVDPGQWVENEAIRKDLREIPVELKFRVIVMQDVIEHLVNPVDKLRKMYAQADRKAELFCCFPCNESRPARINRLGWSMIRPYGHLHCFSNKS